MTEFSLLATKRFAGTVIRAAIYLLEKLDDVEYLRMESSKEESLRDDIVFYNMRKVAPSAIGSRLAENNVIEVGSSFVLLLLLSA